jgi:hypothetical protein
VEDTLVWVEYARVENDVFSEDPVRVEDFVSSEDRVRVEDIVSSWAAA